MNEPEKHAKAFLETEGHGKKILHIKTGQTIFKKGSAADTFFYIQSGRAKIMAYTKDREAMVAIMTKGSILANGALNGLKIHTTSAIAIEPCMLTAITKPAMLDFMQESRDLVLFITKYLASRVHGMTDDKIDMLFNGIEKRLIRLLCSLSHHSVEDENGFKILPPKTTQRNLAHLLGTTPSGLNAVMKKLERLGWVVIKRGAIQVHDGLLTSALEERPMSGKKRVKKKPPG